MRAIGGMCLGAAVLALAACNQGGGEANEGAGAAGESSTAASSSVAEGGGTTVEAVQSMMAKRRAGKWQMSLGLNGQATPPQEICITEEQNRAEQAWDPKQAGAGCPDFRARRQGGAVVMTANCPGQAGTSVQMESRITGDFQTSYRIDSTMRQNPAPPSGPAEVRTFLDMKYLGPC